MPRHRYFMCDLSANKVDSIMDFNVALKRRRSRSVFEISVFFAALLSYVLALALSA